MDEQCPEVYDTGQQCELVAGHHFAHQFVSEVFTWSDGPLDRNRLPLWASPWPTSKRVSS